MAFPPVRWMGQLSPTEGTINLSSLAVDAYGCIMLSHAGLGTGTGELR